MSTVTFLLLSTEIDVDSSSFELIPCKAVADGRLSLRQSDSGLMTLMRDYERFNHLSRWYTIYLSIDPDYRQIRQEWVGAALLQLELPLSRNTHMREECERFLGGLARVDEVGYGYEVDVLVTALYSKLYFEDELVCPKYTKRVPKQGYRRIHLQGGFNMFSDALERSLSPDDHYDVHRVCTEIIWFKMLTSSQREMFQALDDEMRAVFYIVHPEHAPPSYNPERQQTPVENDERLGAVGSPLSASSQANPPKRVADTDADADLHPTCTRLNDDDACLVAKETTDAAPLVNSSLRKLQVVIDHGDEFGG
ncbi:hypothetical protein BZA70DRAFT_286172 [Myxozyma melibiosi]|uniref:Uncharacterized protein n=1 Tax=Myxozyma melibiosi TaxID=54550 RepID=A0ABR1EXV4_9ASCO